MEHSGNNNRLLALIGILMLALLIVLTATLVITGRKLDRVLERQSQSATVALPGIPAPPVATVAPDPVSKPQPVSAPLEKRAVQRKPVTGHYTQPEPQVTAPIASAPVAVPAAPVVVAPQPSLVTPPSPQPIVAVPPVPAEPRVQAVSLPAGTVITVRLIDTLHSDRNRQGDPFTATLDEPLFSNGAAVLPRGATVEGRVVGTREAGRVSGLSEMTVELDRLLLSDGKFVSLVTDRVTQLGETSRGADAAKIGTGAAIGAAIGAIAGGGRGAAIGAATGAGAGTAGVVLSRGKPVILPPETRLSFRLRSPVQFETSASPEDPGISSDYPARRPLESRWDHQRPRLRRR